MSIDFNPSLAGATAKQSQGAKGNQSPEQKAELREAAQKFEALMLRQLFVQMQRSSAVDGDKGMATEFYSDMFAEKMAESSSDQGGIGIANVLMRAWGVEPEAVETSGISDEWTPQDLEEFTRYQPPVNGDFSVSESGRTLTVTSRESAVVAPRAGRVQLGDGQARIEHPGGWSTQIEGAKIDPELNGSWVHPGDRVGRGATVSVRITRPVVTVT